VGIEKGKILLANNGEWLYSVSEGVWHMPKVRSYPVSSCQRAAPGDKTLAILGLGLDFIGEVHLSSSKGHQFVLVVTDYFTKWTHAVLLWNMMHQELIAFVLEHVVHQFGIPLTLTTYQGPAFMLQ
jgi:hypothetical protein